MNKKIAAIVGVLVIAVVIAGVGCIGDGSSAKDIAKMTPEGAKSLDHFSFQAMRDDKDLRAIYKNVKKSRISEEDELGIDIDDINYIAEADGITIIVVRFGLKEVRNELKDRDFDKESYKGVEFWIGRYDEAVAISGDKLIIGDGDEVKDCIKVMKGDRRSMYDDDEDVRDVINKLPDGIMTMVATGYGHYEYEDLLASGFVLTKEDEYTLKIKGVLKFEDEDDAEDVRTDLRRELKRGSFDVDVKQSGKFLKFTAKIDIEEWKEIYR